MKTLLIGRDSNLSRTLARTVPDCEVVSGRELVTDPLLLDGFRHHRVRIVINAFRPSSAVRDVSEREAYVTQALVPTGRVLDACRRLDVDRVLYTSSASVYGENSSCEEDDPPAPMNVHAAFKLAAEMLVEQACRQDGLTCTVVRLFNVFGGDDRFSVVSKVIEAARSGATLTVANEGRAERDYIHVDDVARVYAALLDHPRPPDRLNAASGRGVSVRELVETVRGSGLELRVESVERREIERSVGSTGRLAGLLDPGSFRRVQDHIVAAVGR